MKYILLLMFITFLITGCNNPKLCYDCGNGGWQVMDLKCNSNIQANNDFIDCITKHGLYTQQNNTSEIEEGYIKLGTFGINESSSKGAIKVHKFHQWAVDENGNMYLEGMLG